MTGAALKRKAGLNRLRTRMAPDARRRAILAIALEVFSSGEYSTVTMRDVAAAADVNIALIYYYFRSKERLVAEVIGHATRQAFDLYAKRAGRLKDPVAALDAWFQVNATFFAPLRQMAQILVQYQSTLKRNPLIDEQVRKLYRSERGILRRCVAAGVKNGSFRRLDPGAAAMFISAHLDGMCFVSITRPWTQMRSFMGGQWGELWSYLGCKDRLIPRPS
jgi:TetR/AcrR family transcriptional regulator, cholesterol catabolism regulator